MGSSCLVDWLIGFNPVCKVSPSCLGPGDPATKHRLWGKRSTGTPEYLIELVQTLKIGHFSKVSVQSYLAASDGFFLWYFLVEVGIHPLSQWKEALQTKRALAMDSLVMNVVGNNFFTYMLHDKPPAARHNKARFNPCFWGWAGGRPSALNVQLSWPDTNGSDEPESETERD